MIITRQQYTNIITIGRVILFYHSNDNSYDYSNDSNNVFDNDNEFSECYDLKGDEVFQYIIFSPKQIPANFSE